MLGFLTILLSLISAASLPASLERFTPIPDSNEYPRGIKVSEKYRILVKLASDESLWDASIHSTATYKLWPDYLDPQYLPRKHSQTAVHIAQVDSDERIRIRIEMIDGRLIETLRLKPTRLRELAETQRYGSSWVEFEVDPYRFTRSILVEVNAPERDTDALQDGLVFFLNPPSRIPKGNTLVLPTGVIDESSPYLDELNRLLITEESPYDALYIPQDTLVDGRVDIRKPGFRVFGRGMIIGSRWPFVKAHPNWRDGYPPWITPDGEIVKPLLNYKAASPENGYSGHFEGVLVAHPYHFCIGSAEMNENLKTFGWRFSSDGIHGEHKRGSFMRVNDDATYAAEGSIEDCVYWGMVNGACFQFGWGGDQDKTTPVYVRRCDVLRGEWDNLPNPGADGVGSPTAYATRPKGPNAAANRAVFSGTFRGAEELTVRHKYFIDIRVDAQVNRLFYFGSRTEQVSYEDFLLKDIWFEKIPEYAGGITNVLSGKFTIKDFIFENVVIEGKKAMSLSDFAPLEQRNVQNAVFR
ncbi:MAG: hypothetical protein AAGB46_04840 [Verrucomicrobiota bacterium]